MHSVICLGSSPHLHSSVQVRLLPRLPSFIVPLSKPLHRVAVATILGCLLTGCLAEVGREVGRLAHGDPSVDVVIRTDPPGAKVIVDGRDLGLSPVTYHDKSGEQKTFTVEIQKEGYEPLIRSLTRQWDSMRITYRLDPIYFYNLTALPGTKDTAVASARGEEKRIQAPDSESVSDVDEIPRLRKPKSERQAVALVFGISKYREDLIPKVQYARRDAEIMASYLQAVAGVTRSRTKLLVDEEATLSDLTAYVEEWLPRRVNADTTVFFYYAGHGTPNPATGKAFLVPYDGHPDFSSKLYPLDRLYESLEKLPAKEVVVLLDSCFSGASGRSVLPKGARPMGLVVETPLAVNKKVTVLSAASGTQISSDYDKEQHGLFTYFVLKGLRGDADRNGDKAVEVEELYEYVNKNVTAVAAEDLNRDQTPLLQPPIDQLGNRGKIRLTIAGK